MAAFPLSRIPPVAISPRAFRALALSNLVAVCAIVATGAAVRLTGSGLGCPDWPSCTQHHLVAALGNTHAVIEDANRFVTVLLVVLTAVTFGAAWLRRPRRVDLVVLAGALVGGIVADAMLGAAVVYSKLNPWLVSGHMALSLATVVVAAVLVHRSGLHYGAGARHEVRCAWSASLARWLWIPFAATLLTGMATTGSGPHSGGSVGQLVARRLPFTLQSAAWVHSTCAAAFLGVVAVVYLTLERTGAPTQVVIGAKRLLVVGVAQGVLGVTQYATHLPIVLVELHVLGAVSLTIGVLQFQLRQVARDREVGLERHVATRRSESSLVPWRARPHRPAAKDAALSSWAIACSTAAGRIVAPPSPSSWWDR
jgi:cytochrome c oxidase assembly protein subunit 15